LNYARSFVVMLVTVALEGLRQTGIQIFHDRIAADRLSAITSCLEDTFPNTCIEIIEELSQQHYEPLTSSSIAKAFSHYNDSETVRSLYMTAQKRFVQVEWRHGTDPWGRKKDLISVFYGTPGLRSCHQLLEDNDHIIVQDHTGQNVYFAPKRHQDPRSIEWFYGNKGMRVWQRIDNIDMQGIFNQRSTFMMNKVMHRNSSNIPNPKKRKI